MLLPCHRPRTTGVFGSILVATTWALLLTGCTSNDLENNATLGLQWSLEPTPPTVGEATFTCTLWDSLGAAPVTQAALEIEGNMAHAGMQPVFCTAQEVAPGRYRATIPFTMAGDWFLLLDIKLTDGRTLQRKVDVHGVQPR
jgi:hypothetical protein